MTENNNKPFLTPKKRNTLPEIAKENSRDINNERPFSDRYSMSTLENKRLKVSYIDNFFVESSQSSNVVTSTPVCKSRHSLATKKYNINDGTSDKIFDATSFIQEINACNIQKCGILDKLSQMVIFRNSCVCVEQLDPDSLEPLERCIRDYPKLFETNVMYTKFINKILISTTKLSEISLCQHRFNSKYYIVKSGFKSNSYALSDSSKEILNEVKILTLIGKHLHVVDYYDAWIEDEIFHLQLGFISGGSLIDFLMGNNGGFNTINDISKMDKKYKISSETAYVILAHIGSVLVYMHEVLKIFHGDIKPSNILVDLIRYSSNDLAMAKTECHNALLETEPSPKLRFKLCDFGRSGVTSNVIKMDEGDGRYLPTLNDDTSNHHLFASSRDIFALGLTIYDCFGGIVNQDTASSIRKGKWGRWPDNISMEWKNIIKKMSHKNEIWRYTALEIIEMEKVKNYVQLEAINYFKFEDTSNIMEIN